jgi:hypothetical protein
VLKWQTKESEIIKAFGRNLTLSHRETDYEQKQIGPMIGVVCYQNVPVKPLAYPLSMCSKIYILVDSILSQVKVHFDQVYRKIHQYLKHIQLSFSPYNKNPSRNMSSKLSRKKLVIISAGSSPRFITPSSCVSMPCNFSSVVSSCSLVGFVNFFSSLPLV